MHALSGAIGLITYIFEPVKELVEDVVLRRSSQMVGDLFLPSTVLVLVDFHLDNGHKSKMALEQRKNSRFQRCASLTAGRGKQQHEDTWCKTSKYLI
jgi:hypothetical protein